MLQRRKRFDNPLQQYWYILVKRRTTVAFCLAAALLLTFVYNQSLSPLYRSEARLLIEDTSRLTGVTEGSNRFNMDWYLTQFQILTSRPIILKVAEKLDLAHQSWSSPTSIETLKARVLGRPQRKADPPPRPESLVPLLQRSISIQPQTTNGLVALSVVAAKPDIAHDITNALIDTFIAENIQARLQMSFAASEYLTRQLQKVSENIREAEKALEDFEQLEGIQGLPAAVPLEGQQLADFVTKLYETRTARWELSEKLRVLKQVVEANDYAGLRTSKMEGSAIGELSTSLFEAQLRLDKLADQGLMEKHPEVIQARENIDTLKKRLVFESRTLIAGLQTELAATEQREASLDATIREFQKPAAEATRKQAQHAFLQREIEIQRGFYESYNEQLKKTELAGEARPVSVRVIEPASLPGGPFAPNERFNLTVGLLAGIFLGIFLAFFREYLDDTIKSAEDVQEYLEVPVLGTIPIIGESRSGAPDLQRRVDAGSLVNEAYRSLRTNLQFFESERPLQVLLVTSGAPAEGKSTTVANIALTLVQMGKRVCIVDTDLRKPVLHKLFGKPNRAGVTSLFSGITDKRRLLLPSGYDNLYLLPCGPIPPNPAELLSSPRMEEAVRNLRKDFDYVLFDSPPVLAVTDALIVSALVDGVLLVIKSGEAKIRTCQLALDSLMGIKANVVGIILNHFNYKQSGYHRYYYSKYYREGYGYGYGYGHGAQDKAEVGSGSSASAASGASQLPPQG